MAKFYGKIGYVKTVETSKDIWEDTIIERSYSGDILSNSRRWENSGDINDDVKIDSRISIVADSFALTSFHLMRYVEWMGVKWKITNSNIQHPRIILSLGGIYND